MTQIICIPAIVALEVHGIAFSHMFRMQLDEILDMSPERFDRPLEFVHRNSEPVRFVVLLHIHEWVKFHFAMEMNIRSADASTRKLPPRTTAHSLYPPIPSVRLQKRVLEKETRVEATHIAVPIKTSTVRLSKRKTEPTTRCLEGDISALS